jgi:hypothetical protein
MSTQILDRSKSLDLYFNDVHIAASHSIPVNQMSTRVDALEASIQDIINGDAVSVPQSPAPQVGTTGALR